MVKLRTSDVTVGIPTNSIKPKIFGKRKAYSFNIFRKPSLERLEIVIMYMLLKGLKAHQPENE
ncbi:MAG: hypothetical protein ACLFQA_05910 [Bacteroidales bacterium]